MTDINKMVEQHILQHESRLKHIDELLERAKKVAQKPGEDTELHAEFADLEQGRDELSSHIQEMKKASPDWQKKALEKAGPMGLWDAVAQRLERLVERVEGRKKTD